MPSYAINVTSTIFSYFTKPGSPFFLAFSCAQNNLNGILIKYPLLTKDIWTKCTIYKEIDIAYQQLQPMHGLKTKLYQKLDTI